MTELAFCIHPSLSRERQQLVLELRELTEQGETRSTPMNYERLQAWAKPDERALVQLLRQAKTLNSTWNFVLIPVGLTDEILQYLAGTGKVFCGEQRLILNVFSEHPLIYEALNEKGQMLVEGKIRWGKELLPLDAFDVLFPGEHPYALKGMVLKRLKKVHWKWIRRVLDGPWTLSDPLEMERFRRDFGDEEVPLAPEVHFFGEVEQAPEPIPILHLTDRQGGFARLEMEYGDERIAYQDLMSQVGPWSRDKEAEQYWEADLLETGKGITWFRESTK